MYTPSSPGGVHDNTVISFWWQTTYQCGDNSTHNLSEEECFRSASTVVWIHELRGCLLFGFWYAASSENSAYTNWMGKFVHKSWCIWQVIQCEVNRRQLKMDQRRRQQFKQLHRIVLMYVCINVCINVCMYVCGYVCGMWVCMYVCMYVCIYLSIYLSMYLCIYLSMY